MNAIPRHVPARSFAAEFRKMRMSRQLSLRATAERAGISASFLTDIEHNRRMPSRRLMQKLAEAVGRTESELQQFDPRESLQAILDCVAIRPEVAAPLAKICRRLEAGRLELKAVEALGDG